MLTESARAALQVVRVDRKLAKLLSNVWTYRRSPMVIRLSSGCVSLGFGPTTCIRRNPRHGRRSERDVSTLVDRERAGAMAKAQKIDGGGKCLKCKRTMQRRCHRSDWLPKQNQPYYFRYWDLCRCGHLQHYESAKVLIDRSAIDWAADFEPLPP